MDNFGEYSWAIRSSECDSKGVATLSAILNLLQEAASINAEELGFSKTNFEALGENISWVLTRLKINMTSYPRWGEKIKIVTWPRGGRKIIANRDFEIYSSSGKKLGVATTEWMIIDLGARKVVAIPEAVFMLVNDVRTPVFGDMAYSKFKWEIHGKVLQFPVVAARSDIDLNAHVNNVRYSEWIFNSLPLGLENCREFEIAFKQETRIGESLMCESYEVEKGEFIHRIVSQIDGKEKVVARSIF